MIEDLLRNGLDPNVLWHEDDLIDCKDENHGTLWTHWNTPLHLAIRVEDHDSAEVILRWGGDVDLCNAAGHTPLREAIDHNSSLSARLLLRHGADPNNRATIEAASHFEWSIADLALLASEGDNLLRLIGEFSTLPTPLLCGLQSRQSKDREVLASLARRFDLDSLDVNLGKTHEFEPADNTTGTPHALSVAKQCLVAGDSRDNLFQPRPQRLTVCRPIPLHLELPKWSRPKPEKEAISELAVYPDDRLVRDTPFIGPIHQRAWILQEQAMSTRMLYFGAGILHWECLERYFLEPKPCSYDNMSGNSAFYKRRNNKLIIKDLVPDAPDKQTPFRLWQSYVHEFTGREMTKPSDRIPAFLAISKALEKVLDDSFIDGIWRGDNMLDSLCWRLSQPDASKPTGPTWTWASRSGQVSYGYLEHKGRRTTKASVIACDATSNQSQSCISGSITLKGTLTLLLNGNGVGAHYDHTSGRPTKCYALDLVAFEKAAQPPQARTPSHIFACRWPQWDEQSGGVLRLLLRPKDPAEDFRTATVFQRIGLYFYSDQLYHIDQRRDTDEMHGTVAPEIPSIDWTSMPLSLDGVSLEDDDEWQAILTAQYPDLELSD
ncbi:HET domain-containing protein [Colletotrichum plurivorum]|uniref:HET domain-containing protein n=1 Tax=Colletotrichum plurivorum TaxID=2175906 RepID=A0A8H6JGV7_9PEZI|nr:HET domain-containing protein [Colletotrichum plurivorum]